jgi:hypothetical protein
MVCPLSRNARPEDIYTSNALATSYFHVQDMHISAVYIHKIRKIPYALYAFLRRNGLAGGLHKSQRFVWIAMTCTSHERRFSGDVGVRYLRICEEEGWRYTRFHREPSAMHLASWHPHFSGQKVVAAGSQKSKVHVLRRIP